MLCIWIQYEYSRGGKKWELAIRLNCGWGWFKTVVSLCRVTLVKNCESVRTPPAVFVPGFYCA